jgi:hypothetical protein
LGVNFYLYLIIKDVRVPWFGFFQHFFSGFALPLKPNYPQLSLKIKSHKKNGTGNMFNPTDLQRPEDEPHPSRKLWRATYRSRTSLIIQGNFGEPRIEAGLLYVRDPALILTDL